VRRRALFLLLLLSIYVTIGKLRAQSVPEDNLYLLVHPNFHEIYLNLKMSQGQSYLSLIEVLQLFEIPFSVGKDSAGNMTTVSGGPQQISDWKIDFRNSIVYMKAKNKPLNSDDFLPDGRDLYLKIEWFDSLFEVRWAQNEASMALSFESSRELPFQCRLRREYARRQLPLGSGAAALIVDSTLERKRRMFGVGALDYRYSFDHSAIGRNLEVRLQAGIELLGGDLAGSLAIQQLRDEFNVGKQLTNWRFVTHRGSSGQYSLRPAQVLIGRPAMTGVSGEAIKGIYVSNSNVMPRRNTASNLLEGSTVPLSTVDLWFSGRLIDYTKADSLGNFAFRLPLNYGQSRVELRMYPPNGGEIIEFRQLNLPFAFVPAGQLNYHVQLGQSLQTPGRWLAGGEVEAGITPELSARLGLNSKQENSGIPVGFHASLHARILQQYLFQYSTSDQGNNRWSLGTVFSNRMSTNISYETMRTTAPGILVTSTSGYKSRLQFQHIMPLSLNNRPLGFRIDGEMSTTQTGLRALLMADALMNQGPFTNRVQIKLTGTKNRISDVIGQSWETNAELQAQTVFIVPRWRFVPSFIQGLNFRGSVSTDFRRLTAQSSSGGQFRFSVAKNIGQKGRIQFQASRPIQGKGMQLGINLQYDFKPLRTSTDWATLVGGGNTQAQLRHTGMGSVLWDASTHRVSGASAEQVGRSGLVVRFFMDENENRNYDVGELVVPVPGARLDKSYAGQLGKDNLLRFLQLQSYWRYELNIEPNTMPEADLVALAVRFPFIARPNQMHLIDVPLYRAGSISGEIVQNLNGQAIPLGGVRIVVTRSGEQTGHFSTVIRSFADGSYFIDQLQPGSYCLKLDQQQLDFLGGRSFPDSINLEIGARVDGQYFEEMSFAIIPKSPDVEDAPNRPIYVSQYRERIRGRARDCVATFLEAQHLFYLEEWNQAQVFVDSSLALFSTDYGRALKGSLRFVQGDTLLAYQYWREAGKRNPWIELPKLNGIPGEGEADVLPQRSSVPITGKGDTVLMVNGTSSRIRQYYQSRAQIAVSSFVETQELLYQGCHHEALDMLDFSLRTFTSDYALALRGSISFLLGYKADAQRFWALALERNPLIQISEPVFLNQMLSHSSPTKSTPWVPNQ